MCSGESGLHAAPSHDPEFRKAYDEGMNYFTTDIVELLENTIPSEFGVGSGDYQLIEEEDTSGQTRLTLLVHPNVSGLNEETLLFRLRQNLAEGSGTIVLCPKSGKTRAPSESGGKLPMPARGEKYYPCAG